MEGFLPNYTKYLKPADCNLTGTCILDNARGYLEENVYEGQHASHGYTPFFHRGETSNMSGSFYFYFVKFHSRWNGNTSEDIHCLFSCDVIKFYNQTLQGLLNFYYHHVKEHLKPYLLTSLKFDSVLRFENRAIWIFQFSATMWHQAECRENLFCLKVRHLLSIFSSLNISSIRRGVYVKVH